MAVFVFTTMLTMLLTACSVPSSDATVNLLDPELRTAYENYSNTWQQRRTTLEFDNDQSADNCAAYIELTAKHDIKETVFNQQVHGEYLVCEALKLLGSSVKIENASVPPELGARLAKELDLRSFASSLNQQSDAERHTLSSLDPAHLKVQGATAELDSEDWHFWMGVVAVADVNGNGVKDWIVWVADEAKLGNYRAYSTVLVFDPGANSSLKGNNYPPSVGDGGL